MKSQELLKELKSFPKEFNPNEARQKQTLKNIMDFYDGYEKNKVKSFSFQRWQAAVAGLAAILLASFLFLPNLLNHENKSHEAIQPEVRKDIVTPQTTAKKSSDLNQNDQFYSKELTEVNSITMMKPKAISQKKISDPAIIDPILQIFKQAKFVEKQNKERENSLDDQPPYLIEFHLKDGLISINYWPEEKGANILDIQQRSWWRVENLNLNNVLDMMLQKSSFQVINQDLALSTLKSLHPDIDWEKEYSLEPTNDNKVLVATGVKQSSGELIQIELDSVTGKAIGKEKHESTQEAKKAAETFFRLVGFGNLETAWGLIHPKSKVPSPGSKEEQTKKSFEDYFKAHKLNFKRIDSIKWTPLQYKFPDCMCVFVKEVLIEATLSDGTKAEFHVIQDDDNQWKLYWSNESNKLL